MKQTQLLANRIREVYLNGTWIANTNYKQLLESITWEQANHTIGNLNTIALLTFHVNYYLQGLILVFDGGSLDIKDKYSFDMPPLKSTSDWTSLVNNLIHHAEKFATQIELLDDAILDKSFVDEKYGSYRRNIEGIIEHSYYHLGQISFLIKMIDKNECDMS